MVTKIQPPAKNIGNAVAYNERKMTGAEGVLSKEDEELYRSEGGTGHTVATFNVPDTSTLENEFTRLKWLSKMNTRGRKLDNPTFHMSINPGETDIRLSEEKITEFAAELMDKLGYGDVPWRLYRHNDTDREHYHVVGTRIGQDGKKVNDSFEHERCERITRELAKKYGYTYGLDKGESKEKSTEKKTATDTAPLPEQNPSPLPASPTEKAPRTEKKNNKGKKRFIPPYRKGENGSDAEQYRSFHEEAMKWHFSTPEQYGFLLKYRFNTEVKTYSDALQYAGLNEKGSEATTPMTEKEAGIDAMSDVLKRIKATDMKPKKAQRERLEKNIREAADMAEGWNDFKKNLASRGIITAVSWTEDNRPFGITWLDRATRCAWKASETEATLAWIQETAKTKGWKITRNPRYERAENPDSKKMEKATILANSKSSGQLSDYSDKHKMNSLIDRKGLGRTRRNDSDASKNKSEIRYGDDNDNNDIII